MRGAAPVRAGGGDGKGFFLGDIYRRGEVGGGGG